MPEKRTHERERYLSPLTVFAGNNKVLAVAMNISPGGIGVISDKPIPRGAVTVQIHNEKIPGVLVFQNKEEKGVVKTDSAVYQLGIQFKQPLQKEKVRVLLNKQS